MPKAGRESPSKGEFKMSTRTARKSAAKSAESVQVAEAVATDAAVTQSKPTAHERLTEVLAKIDKATAKELEPADVKWGKAIGLLGGGSVYINRSNADVRSTTKQVADWAKAGLGTIRGPQGQYLRISF
jgi:hypothetical protein